MTSKSGKFTIDALVDMLERTGEHVPATSAECKQRCGGVLPERLTFPGDYMGNFPKDLLDGRRDDVPELDQLLGCLFFSD